ncbi:MAG: hypothetical protein DSZ07_03470, partial [Sulfurovum sp.]
MILLLKFINRLLLCLVSSRYCYTRSPNKTFSHSSSPKIVAFPSLEIKDILSLPRLLKEIFTPLQVVFQRLTLKGEIDLYSTKSLAFIHNRLETFLQDGAFPETLLFDERIREKILRDYYNVMIYKDLIERFSIKNIEVLKFFLKRILASSTKLVSVNKIY